ncbi:MAG: hypothetical protein D6719_00205 [Candidatus Dadabacteria bacterium]|nr:MAG: hypothetical protein D6719_00205 [Candidatus Dadabacteria bacterium]
MQYPFSKKISSESLYTDDRGIFMIIVAAGAVALVALIGLAVDCANIYLTKRQVQTVVDSAALAGGRILVFQIDATIDDVKARMVNLARENLAKMNFSQEDIDRIAPDPEGGLPPSCDSEEAINSALCISVAENRQELQIAMRTMPQLHFIHILPGISKFLEVSAAAKAVNTKLQVVLVLDVSWSMGEPVPNPPAGCWNRLCAAQYAANKFLDMMLPFDEAAIVTFSSNYSDDIRPPVTAAQMLNNYSNDARVEYPCPDYVNPASPPPPPSCASSPFLQMGVKGRTPAEDSAARQKFRAIIDSLHKEHNTNIAAGLYKARRLFSGPVPENTQRAIVLFTDGSPYTRREGFSGPISTPDQTMQAILQNPSDTVDTDMYFLQCGNRSLEKNKLQLRQLGVPALMPASRRYVDINDGPFADQEPGHGNNLIEVRRRLRFIDAILEAQAAQDRGVIVYTIGLGPIDQGIYPSRTDDPYPAPRTYYSAFQSGGIDPIHNIRYSEQVKEAFMALMANDQARLKNPTVLPDPMPAGYEASYFWKFPCVPNGPERVGKPEGIFVSVSDGEGLVNAFELIAHDLRTRLEM